MRLEVIIYCHNFQKRLCWVLSSIAQQKGDIPDILINIASMKNNGIPTTEEVIKNFSWRGLDIKHTVFDSTEEMAYPSLTKNRQIKESKSDWFAFHSADQIFHYDFFAELGMYLRGNYRDESRCIASHNKILIAKDSIDANLSDEMYVEQAFSKAIRMEWVERKTRYRIGGHLIVSRQAIIEKNGGYYVDPLQCKDRHVFNRGMKTRSDIGFRKRMGGTTALDLPLMIHLEHDRDKEVGHHLEVQR